MKKNTQFNKDLLIALIVFSAIASYCFYENVDKATTISIVSNWVTFVVAVVGLYFFYRRIRNQDEQVKQQVEGVVLQREQIDLQIVQRTDERFTTAVSLLGSSESSARTGAIYALYHLAVDDEDKKYRRQIAQILCSHIRSKTQEGDYQGKLKDDNHKKRPSNEIQTCIDLLFKPKSKGLYTKYAADLDEANLSHAYLVGANFYKAQCQRAYFYKARCQGVGFYHAQCQGADFSDAQCQGASFSNAQCQGANFDDAQCQGANFGRAQCQGAHFSDAQCQGASFSNAQCQGAHFSDAQCQGANFGRAQCQGVNFVSAQCQGAHFMRANLEGAHALEDGDWLEFRVKKDTELENMVFAGPLNDKAIKAIEVAKEYISDEKYERLEKVIEANKNEEINCMNVPKGIITGVLEDSEEMQAIIARDWDKLEELEKAKKLAGVNKSREVRSARLKSMK